VLPGFNKKNYPAAGTQCKGNGENMHTDNTQLRLEEHRIEQEPFYLALGREVEIAEAAYASRLPLLLKGPTGCGKTRFMQYMAWKLERPLITVSCHDDLSTADLVGRYLIRSGEAVWSDGPLTLAVRSGAICYLDEIVEARKDTTVVIHPLADDRRELPIEKRGELLVAPPEFMLAVSYNPGYQSVLKDLKPSTRQRFIALTFDYPDPERETEIVAAESGVKTEVARLLVRLGVMTRGLKDSGLPEGASTRLLVQAGKLMGRGVDVQAACHHAITETLTDDKELLQAVDEMVSSVF
jgi:nitric oxide reductase NorQ protein